MTARESRRRCIARIPPTIMVSRVVRATQRRNRKAATAKGRENEGAAVAVGSMIQTCQMNRRRHAPGRPNLMKKRLSKLKKKHAGRRKRFGPCGLQTALRQHGIRPLQP